MMLTLIVTNRFEKSAKKMFKRGKNREKLKIVIDLLLAEKPLPPKYRNHLLTGNWLGFYECHIEPDWLLIYQMTDDELTLVETGSHADLF